jgi:hypothetical protein
MNCHDVQSNLSLYLYGELDFAREEALEQHLATCAFCQQALDREKAWHTILNAEQADVPLDFLASCRKDMRGGIARFGSDAPRLSRWRSWFHSFHLASSTWSTRLAATSFLVILGFGAGRWFDRDGIGGFARLGNESEMGLLSPYSRVREIQPTDSGRVRIIIDQIQQRELIGGLEDQNIRRVLLSATQDPSDPAIRVDSVEMLSRQGGIDIRDALLSSVRHDPNPAVRLKALEGLRRFAADDATRQTLKQVLEHDDNAGVRSEAIDVLAPASEGTYFSPDLANTLQEIMRQEQNDQYVRTRCWEALQKMKASPDVY